jgi:hypothetical protein
VLSTAGIVDFEAPTVTESTPLAQVMRIILIHSYTHTPRLRRCRCCLRCTNVRISLW